MPRRNTKPAAALRDEIRALTAQLEAMNAEAEGRRRKRRMSNAYASAPEADIILSTRVRLARNYADLPFEAKIAPEEAQEVIKRAAARLCGDEDEHFTFLRMSSLDENERKVLSEKRLVSLDLLAKPETGAALVSDDETVSVMLNEEDHLRIQAMLPGSSRSARRRRRSMPTTRLGAAEPFAFDAKWGYLTSSPTNAGTGMRASAILHLPALTLSKRMGALAQAVGKLGFTLRGMYGEAEKPTDACIRCPIRRQSAGRRTTSFRIFSPCARRRRSRSARSANA